MTQMASLRWTTQLTLLHMTCGLASAKASTSIGGTQRQPLVWRSL